MLEPGRQRLEPVHLERRLQLRADPLVVRQGVGVDARHDRPQPEPRTADEDPDPPAPSERPQRVERVGPEVGD